MAKTRWAVALAGLALSLGPVGLAGPASLGCGMLAPFGTACEDCCLAMGTAPAAEANLLGYVGVLEMRLDGPSGAWVWRCSTVALDDPVPVPLEQCIGPLPEGTPPSPGDSVVLRCLALPLQDSQGLAGPAGPWGCRVYP